MLFLWFWLTSVNRIQIHDLKHIRNWSGSETQLKIFYSIIPKTKYPLDSDFLPQVFTFQALWYSSSSLNIKGLLPPSRFSTLFYPRPGLDIPFFPSPLDILPKKIASKKKRKKRSHKPVLKEDELTVVPLESCNPLDRFRHSDTSVGPAKKIP